MNKLTEIRKNRYSKMFNIENPKPGDLMEASKKRLTEEKDKRISLLKKIALHGD